MGGIAVRGGAEEVVMEVQPKSAMPGNKDAMSKARLEKDKDDAIVLFIFLFQLKLAV
jgi:hypothetical protein